MINLLPEKEKQTLNKEYKFRLVIVALWLAIVLVVGAIILIVPSLASIVAKKVEAESKIAALTDGETEEQLQHEEQLKNLKQATIVLKPGAARVMPTTLLEAILEQKTAGNVISSIHYGLDESKKLKAIVTGVAKTRQSLVQFIDGLREHKIIGSVDLPVSNLAQETNIKFNITIIGI